MLLMCDRSPTMSRGDSGPDGEEPALPLSTAAGGGGQMGPSGDLGGRAQIEHLGGGERGALREGGQEDEEMTNVSHDLSSSSNQSPESATGSTSSFIKREHAGGGRGQARRDMMDTVAEMKRRLPSDRRSRNKASTVDALNYALNCVKQVQANSEYYKLLMQNGQDQRKDATVCTLEELERVTSEHNLKNTDSFVMVFSLSSGRVLYASEQAPSLLCCKRKYLESAKFVELLFHQDVNVFYSHTAQPHLPPWSNSHSAGVLFDSAQVKSFFCRIRGSKDRDGEMRYNPFRITPYLLKVQGTESGEEEEPCCLALAERIISGYEAPRIPMDKRIFTTTHSPGCIFLEVDDRAVPLLGYLPQDLIGTSLLTCIHPEDFPLMLSMHRKVLKYAGQPPFEHSPVRLRCQNGDYVTLDTSWSSFINPWSRKVAFIIGRHKVRTSPLNEDVLAALNRTEVPVSHEEIKDLQAKIYKLFLQPVHNNGSSGYGSLGSNGSHEHYISFASSSDSNGNLWEDSHREPMTLQQICADVNRAKTWGRQGCLNSCQKRAPHGKPSTGEVVQKILNIKAGHEGSRKQTHIPSYQQINCVDNIVRYLESCAGQVLKRKNESHSLTTSSSSSSTSEEEKPAGGTDVARSSSDVVLLDSEVSVGPAVVGAPLTDITMSSKAMSVAHGCCSFGNATAPEDAPMGSEPADVTATPVRLAPSPATEDRRFVGLTKEVLSAHTQKEEQEYIDRFRHRILQSPYSSYLQLENDSMAHSHHPGVGKLRHKRPKPQGSSDSYASPAGPLYCVPDSSWPSSESSQPHMAQTHCQTSPYNFNIMQLGQSQPGMPPVHMDPHPMASAQSFNPYMAPVMAVIMPNYPTFTPGFPSVYLPSMSSVAPQPPNIMTSFAPGSASHVQPQSPAQPGPHTSPGLPLISQRASSVGEEEEAAEPRALFSSSRSSSPLQLNLLQEELPRLSEGQSSTGHNHSESLHEQLANKVATCTVLFTHNTGFMSNFSKYFASNDSSDTSRKARKSQEAPVEHQHSFDARGENSMWSMIQHTPDHVMMTYQMHPRDQSEVLAEDREKLRVLQPLQPWFTQEQREELAQVHPWIKQHTIPQEIDTEVTQETFLPLFAHINTC
uniref:Period circadian regulator 3 n=1 Tax=Nothobranchius furzeri TaxID=105023 RepID=A0A8C6M774_NOTFU